MAVPESVIKLVDRFESNYDTYKSLSYNEEDIKIDFINPLFEALGWDVGNKTNKPPELREVKFEDSVEVQGRIKNPDYSFRLDRARKFFVEAKKPAVNIEAGISPAFQLRSYAWSATLPFSIVTDFEEFAVYDCRNEPSKLDKPTKSRLFIIKYYEFEKRWDEISSLFSKEAVQNGSLDKYLESMPTKRGTKKVDDALLEDISEWRKTLAVNIAKMNPSLDQKSLNHAVQMTIDRILFLRICEDRSIEDYGRLKKLIEGNNVYQRLFMLFEEADKRYNSGLFHFHSEEDRNNFDTITPSIIIEDKVLQDIIRGLYFPDCPYVFSEIPAEILGSVYEQFLGKVIQLNEDHEVNIEYKPEVRKAGGVYYTPTYIVDYIVKNTVGKLLDGKSPQDASDLRILDPACGSGSFLIGAYQYLLDWHLNWYKSNLVPLLNAGQKLTSKEVQGLLPAPIEKPGKNARARSKRIWERASVATLPIEQRAEEWYLRTAERKRILLNNIYGVDIDTQAVEVTKLSLLLKVLEGENKATIADLTMYSDERALPDLGNNIKCGNSLIGWDILDDNQDLTQEELWRINPFGWEDGFKEVFAHGGFDAVIGNPPYIRMEGFKEFKEYLRNHFVSHEERSDLYTYFIENSHKILNESGLYGVIVSNKFLRAKYGKPLREFLCNNANLHQIVDLAGLPVFSEATVRPIILITSLKTLVNHSTIYSPPLGSGEFQLVEKGLISLENAILDTSYKLRAEDLHKNVWSFSRGDINSLITKLGETFLPLKEYNNLTIGYGIKTGFEKAFVIDEATKNTLVNKDRKSQEIIKPYLNGRDIRRYILDFKKVYLIYTYRGIDIEQYPAVKEYLLPFRDNLIKRATKQEWYELQQPQFKYSPYFDRQKIVFPDIAISPRFALDNSGFYGSTTTFFVSQSDHYLLGLLNSKLSYLYFSENCAALEGKNEKYLRFKSQYLENFPVRIINHSDPYDVSLYNKMISLVEKMLNLHDKLASSMTEHEKTMLSRQIQATDDQINSLVYELYELSEEEIRIVNTM